MLTTDPKERKEYPMARGLLDYFPLALAEVAHVSFIGNRQHNGDTPLHWDRSKSPDHADCIIRHLAERGKTDTDGLLHSIKVAWRALAMAELELENRAKDCTKQTCASHGMPHKVEKIRGGDPDDPTNYDPGKALPEEARWFCRGNNCTYRVHVGIVEFKYLHSDWLASATFPTLEFKYLHSDWLASATFPTLEIFLENIKLGKLEELP